MSNPITIADLAAVAKAMSANANEASSKYHSESKQYRDTRRLVYAADLLLSALETTEDAIVVGKDERAEFAMQRMGRIIADALAQAERDGMRRASNAINALEA